MNDKANSLKIKMFNGIEVVIDHCLDRQVQNKQHKKARINKKWAKRFGYHYENVGQVYYVRPTEIGRKYLVMGQAMYEMLEKEIGK